MPLRVQAEELPLAGANEALERLRRGGVRGSLVLRVRPSSAAADRTPIV